MKRELIMMSLAAALMLGGAGSAQAFPGPGDEAGGPPPGREMSKEEHFDRMAEVLKLTDVQKEKIKAILAAERELVEPVRNKLGEHREALRQAAEAETFDEAAVRNIAAAEADLMSELTVSRIKTQRRIDAVLTAEQKELAAKLRPMKRGKGGPPEFTGER